MKKLTLLVAILTVAILFSCNEQADEQKKGEENTQEQIKIEAEDAQASPKQSKTIVVNEPTVINIEEVEKGGEFFGLTVSEAQIPNNQEFSFTIAEEFILEGNVSEGEFGTTFNAADPTRSNAVLKIDDMEKPFFMWTTFNNNEAFMAALSDEQKQKINTMEGLPVKVKLKNYKVSASAEHMMISAWADFVEVVE
jgi:hypothetical protein